MVQNRLLEGHGEALFDLGQEDNGESMQFSKEQWDVALDRIRRASSFLRAECRILLTRNIGGPEEAEVKNEKEKGCTAKLLLRQEPETVEDVIETRIAVVGNGRKSSIPLKTTTDEKHEVDAGKSTMLGVLVKGGLDDGRGKARVNLFRHKHEIESGRTSSVGMEIMGFDTKGDIVTSSVPGRKLTWEEIGKRSVEHVIPSHWTLLIIHRRKSSASPIWQVMRDTLEPPFSAFSVAAPTTACSWWPRTTD